MKDTIKALIVLNLLLILGVYLQHKYSNESKLTLINTTETWNTVDSTWFTKPSQEHSLQTSYKYYGHLTDGSTITSNKPIQIGDSIKYIYYQYQKKKKIMNVDISNMKDWPVKLGELPRKGTKYNIQKIINEDKEVWVDSKEALMHLEELYQSCWCDGAVERDNGFTNWEQTQDFQNFINEK